MRSQEPTPARLAELNDLVTRLLIAQEHRRSVTSGSPAWRALTSEIEDLMQRVWHPVANAPGTP